jgi:hypothetical protein
MTIIIFLICVAGGMRGADIGLGWIDHAGNVHFQVCIVCLTKCDLNRLVYLV